MRTQYTFRHTDSSDALQQHAEEKLAKLEHFALEPALAHVIIETDGHHLVKVEVDYRDKGFHTTATSDGNGEDIYKILDDTLRKLERQLRRHKEKVKAH